MNSLIANSIVVGSVIKWDRRGKIETGNSLSSGEEYMDCSTYCRHCPSDCRNDCTDTCPKDCGHCPRDGDIWCSSHCGWQK